MARLQVDVLRAEFVKSAVSPADCPPVETREVAFAGRSNVGKSSVINLLVARRNLVRTSATPGCTRLLNFFYVEIAARGREMVRAAFSFADLPGFGYAKVAKAERTTWRRMIEDYFTARPMLGTVVLLLDARRGVEDEERELVPWLKDRGMRVIPVLTKIDKLAKHERTLMVQAVARALAEQPIACSALSGEGREELWARLLATADSATGTDSSTPV